MPSFCSNATLLTPGQHPADSRRSRSAYKRTFSCKHIVSCIFLMELQRSPEMMGCAGYRNARLA